MERSRSATVSFNVGGRIFEVLREPTLSLHPESLLTQLAEDHDTDDPIFVESNPDLFPYVLDYLRHRQIFIPVTVSRMAVLRECRTLGLVVDGDSVSQDVHSLALSRELAAEALARVKEEVTSEMAQSKATLVADLIVESVVQKLNQNTVEEVAAKGLGRSSNSTIMDFVGSEFNQLALDSGVPADVGSSFSRENNIFVATFVACDIQQLDAQQKSKGCASKGAGGRGRGGGIQPNWVPPQQPTGKGCAGKGLSPLFRHSNSIHVTSVGNSQASRAGKGKTSSIADVLFHGMSSELLRQRLDWWSGHLGYTFQLVEPVLEERVRQEDAPYSGHVVTSPLQCLFTPSLPSQLADQ